MSKIISACGLVCSGCPAYVATQANDVDAIARVAAEWTVTYNTKVSPEHVWCDGCLTEGPRKCHHAGECEVRACVVERGLSNCAQCDDYGCARIEAFFAMVPQARTVLDGLRA